MKLYYSPGACSLAIRIVIHELGLKCEYERVNLQEKKTETGADFWKINAKGAVPTLQLDTGEILTENPVIQQYLLDTHPHHQVLPAIGNMKRYRVLEWLNFVSMDLHRSCSPLFNGSISEGLKVTVFRPMLKTKLSIVNAHLAKHSCLMGDHFTLPDAYLFVVCRWLAKLGVEIAEFPHLHKFFNEMKNRPSIQASLKEEGL